MDSSLTSSTSQVFILFGATGNLAVKKIMPALQAVFSQKESPKITIIAFSRRPWTDEEYRNFIVSALPDTKDRQGFLKTIRYVQGTFDDSQAYTHLKQKITDALEEKAALATIVCHFAVEPEFYAHIARGLAGAGLSANMKIMIEKPFGRDYASALKQDKEIAEFFQEDQIYHVDHYRAKSGLREIDGKINNDPELKASFNSKHIQEVNLFLFENGGIEGRGRFYDAIGALRDVGQNHMMEMLGMLLLPPISEEKLAEDRAARVALFNSFQLSSVHLVRRGQYEGYWKEPDVKGDSQTETYFDFSITSDILRWVGIPFRFQGGKSLINRKEIEVVFKDNTKVIFPIGPNDSGHSEAYKILIGKAFTGQASFFLDIQEVLAEWNIIDQVMTEKEKVTLLMYKKGATGV